MKRSFYANLLVLGLVLAIGGAGCKSVKKPVTAIPQPPIEVKETTPTAPVGPRNVGPGQGNLGGPITRPTGPTLPPVNPIPLDTNVVTSIPLDTNITAMVTDTNRNTSLAPRDFFDDRPMDREMFRTQTVYFDFDSSAVKPTERAKLDPIADYLKKNPNDALLIEGHCDERGTEEYNRALGERRALSLREEMAKKGVLPDRIRTLSWGEDHPIDPGHNDAAWTKNRRGEFIKLGPKMAPGTVPVTAPQ